MTIPLFCLALCAVCKSVTQEVNAGAKLLSSQLRSCGTLQALQRTERSQTACHSWIHPLTKKKKKIFAHPEQSQRSQLSVHAHTRTQTHNYAMPKCSFSGDYKTCRDTISFQLFIPCVSAVIHFSSIWRVPT